MPTAWPEPWSIMVVVPGCTPFSSELREATDMRVGVPTHTVLMSRQTDPVQSSLRTWGPRTQRPSCFLLDEDGEGGRGGACPSPWSRRMVLCSWEARGCGNRPVTRACVQKRLRKPSAAREKGKGKMEGRREILKRTKIEGK